MVKPGDKNTGWASYIRRRKGPTKKRNINGCLPCPECQNENRYVIPTKNIIVCPGCGICLEGKAVWG